MTRSLTLPALILLRFLCLLAARASVERWCIIPRVAHEERSTAEVLTALQQGQDEETNFHCLFERYYRRVRDYFRHKQISPADSEELTQEVFISVFKSMGQLRQPAQFEAWLFRIALNVFRSHLERGQAQKRQGATASIEEAMNLAEPEADHPHLIKAEADPMAALLDAEKHEQVLSALQTLPEQMRHCLHLRVIEEFSYQEIAAIMEISINTVKAHLFQARRQLAERLKGFFKAEAV